MSSEWFDDVTVAGKMTPTDLAAKLTPSSAARPPSRRVVASFRRLRRPFHPPRPRAALAICSSACSAAVRRSRGSTRGMSSAFWKRRKPPLRSRCRWYRRAASSRMYRLRTPASRSRWIVCVSWITPAAANSASYSTSTPKTKPKTPLKTCISTAPTACAEGETAALVGFPIFVGLTVGGNGVMFRCYTVAVSNSQDEALLRVLESDVFRMGLQLVETAQPAIVPFSSLAFEFTRTVAKRNQNVAVQDINLGLDFTRNPVRARLREGSYVVVQAPDAEVASWDWGKYVFNPANGQVVKADKLNEMIPYNYFVFSVYRYE